MIIHYPRRRISPPQHPVKITQDIVIDLDAYHRQSVQHRRDLDRKREDELQTLAQNWLQKVGRYDGNPLPYSHPALRRLLIEHRPVSLGHITKICKIIVETPLYGVTAR